MDENKAAGLDSLSGKFLKSVKYLSVIQFFCIKYSTDCKIAKLKPLFEKGSKTAPKNYRPVSLLPFFSKIM